MPHILHRDASARLGIAGKDKHGLHSCNMTHRFIGHRQSRRPQDMVAYQDIGQGMQ